MGGIATVVWDIWLSQKVGKAKAKWESKRRRARDEAGDAEETVASQDVQSAQELHIQRPGAVKRRAQGGSSTDRIIAEEAPSESGQVRDRTGTESAGALSPSPSHAVDIKTHNISVKLGVSLIAAFFGKVLRSVA